MISVLTILLAVIILQLHRPRLAQNLVSHFHHSGTYASRPLTDEVADEMFILLADIYRNATEEGLIDHFESHGHLSLEGDV